MDIIIEGILNFNPSCLLMVGVHAYTCMVGRKQPKTGCPISHCNILSCAHTSNYVPASNHSRWDVHWICIDVSTCRGLCIVTVAPNITRLKYQREAEVAAGHKHKSLKSTGL